MQCAILWWKLFVTSWLKNDVNHALACPAESANTTFAWHKLVAILCCYEAFWRVFFTIEKVVVEVDSRHCNFSGLLHELCQLAVHLPSILFQVSLFLISCLLLDSCKSFLARKSTRAYPRRINDLTRRHPGHHCMLLLSFRRPKTTGSLLIKAFVGRNYGGTILSFIARAMVEYSRALRIADWDREDLLVQQLVVGFDSDDAWVFPLITQILDLNRQFISFILDSCLGDYDLSRIISSGVSFFHTLFTHPWPLRAKVLWTQTRAVSFGAWYGALV